MTRIRFSLSIYFRPIMSCKWANKQIVRKIWYYCLIRVMASWMRRRSFSFSLKQVKWFWNQTSKSLHDHFTLLRRDMSRTWVCNLVYKHKRMYKKIKSACILWSSITLRESYLTVWRCFHVIEKQISVSQDNSNFSKSLLFFKNRKVTAKLFQSFFTTHV